MPNAYHGSAFDGDPNTWWDACCKGYPDQNLLYSFVRAVKASGYSLMTMSGECPAAWEVACSTVVASPVDPSELPTGLQRTKEPPTGSLSG